MSLVAGPRPHVIAIAVTDRLPVFELAVPCEVFGVDRSDIVSPWYELRMCAAEPGALHTTAGLEIDAKYGLEDLLEADTILVPACARATQITPPDPLLDALRAARARGRRIASICTGAYLLAAAGLLDGRRATTHWMNAVDFAHRYPLVQVDPAVLYVDHGDLLTSAGTGAAIDLCLHLVRVDHGAAGRAAVAPRTGARLGPAPARPAAHGGATGPRGADEPAYVRTPVPRDGRRESAALAGTGARAAGAGTAGDDRRAGRADRASDRLRHRGQPAPALRPGDQRVTTDVPARVSPPRRGRVSRVPRLGRRAVAGGSVLTSRLAALASAPVPAPADRSGRPASQ